ncbi:YopX family protein [Metabacillus fastidiosus]|uniref:YopX family protein n=1 Tax=Metabacillus fastidiosus TaxID=1458 RepID=A0ABU6NRQ7_9BACI|nr:YopX family protein [Metabacillus fastidiosus]
MREVKFRVFSNESKEMIYPDENGWFHRCYVGGNGVWQTCSLDGVIRKNGKELEVMQYTGLKDKNGQRIYEGDILSISDREGHNQAVYFGEGYYSTNEFALFELTRGKHRTFEVIGNIYENPELLEVQP